MDVSNLLKNLKGRISTAKKLAKQRNALARQIDNIDRQLQALGGSGLPIKETNGRSPGRKRPQNKIKLSDAIAKVLSKDKPMGAAQIEQEVKKSGYRSASKTFRTIIFQTLAKDKRVKKAGRGRYVLKG